MRRLASLPPWWPARGEAAAALVVALLVAGLFYGLTDPEPAISDPIGYLVAGARLAAGYGPSFADANNEIAGPFFMPFAFQVSRPGDPRHFLGFPPGFPILLAAGTLLQAIYAVVPLLAGLTVVTTYCLGLALGASRGASLRAAGLLAASAAFWQFGTAAWSEIPAALAVGGGTALYLRSRPGQGRAWLWLPAALILSFGQFIRYSNVTFLAALALYELYTARGKLLTERGRWPFWVAIAAGLVAIPLFNHFYYGGALLTSYSPSHGWYPSPPFALGYALGPSFVNGYSLRESLRTLWQNFPVLLLLAPWGLWRLPRPGGVLVAAAILFGLLPYVFYAFAPAGINSRFLLPVFPFLAVACGAALADVAARLNRPFRWAMGAAVVAGLLFLVTGHRTAVTEANAAGRATVAHARALVAPLEPEAVVISYAYNDLIAVYGRRSVLNYRRIPISDPALGRYRTEMLEPCLAGSVARLRDRAIPVYYIVDQQSPAWDPLPILQRHFTLTELSGDPPIIRVGERLEDAAALDESLCGFPP